eukprot:247770_1
MQFSLFVSTSTLSSPPLTCTSTTIISKVIVYIYASIYGLSLFFVSVLSFRALNEDPRFRQHACWKQLKLWLLDLKKRKSCYIPIVAHLFDQLTDLAVIIQFYEIATNELISQNNWAACNGLNMWYLFILSIVALLMYRLITACLIYFYTNKSWTRLLLQIVDLELFRSIKINYLCNKSEPCDPQVWLTAMEAALESIPQSLIQLVYLIKTDAFQFSNILIAISLISSLWSITSKLMQDDKGIVVKQAKNLYFKAKFQTLIDIIIGIFTIVFTIPLLILASPYIFVKGIKNIYRYDSLHEDIFNPVKVRQKPLNTTMSRTSTEWPIIRVINPKSDEEYLIDLYDYNEKEWSILYNDYDRYMTGEDDGKDFISAFIIDQWLCPRSLSWLYVFRVAWRILDLTSRLCIMILTWIVVGGVSLTAIILAEFITILVICIKTKHWELIISIVAVVVSLTEKTKKISATMFCWRTIENLIMLILITIWLFSPFDCSKCTDYVDRQPFSKPTSSMFKIFIYCWVSAVLSPTILIILFSYKTFVVGATTSRALDQMIVAKNWNGILELQLYAQQYGIYDSKTQEELIELATKVDRTAAVAYLLKNYCATWSSREWKECILSSENLDLMFIVALQQ